MVDEIGIVEILNKRLGIDPREKVSTGVIIKSMILNGLGFVSAPPVSVRTVLSRQSNWKAIGRRGKARVSK